MKKLQTINTNELEEKEVSTKILEGRQFADAVLELIEKANENIYITTFDWRWYPDNPAHPIQKIYQALQMAKKRGVVVKVLTNIQYMIDKLHEIGISAKKANTKRLLHAKLVVVDHQYIILGSHNMTQNAISANEEISVLIHSEKSAIRSTIFFDKLYGI